MLSESSDAAFQWRTKQLQERGVRTEGMTETEVMTAHEKMLAERYSVNINRLRPETPTGFVILPQSRFIKVWDLLTIFLLLFTALVTPFEVAFMETKLDVLFVLNRIVDLAFLFDFGVNCVSAFYDKTRDRWELNSRIILRHYLTTWAFWDFVSILPFDAIGFLAGSDAVQNLRFFRFLRLLRLMKLLRVLRASRIVRRWKTRMGISNSVLSLIRFFGGMMLTAHWSACGWFLIAQFQEESDRTWVDAEDVDGVSVVDQYAISLYWSVMTLSTIGYGDVTPVTTVERFYAILNMIIGGSIYAYMVGAVCSIVLNIDLASSAYNRAIDDLNRFMREINLPYELRIELREYFEHCRRLQRNRFYHNLLNDMSPMLRGKVARFQHSQWIEKVPFFNAKDDYERQRFVTSLAMALVPMAFAPFEEVMREREQIHQMYIIQRGMAITRGRLLRPGHTFGEAMILSRHRYTESVRSLMYLDAFMLSRVALIGIMTTGEFPETNQLLRWHAIRVALRRMLLRVKMALNLARAGNEREAQEQVAGMPVQLFIPKVSDAKRRTFASFVTSEESKEVPVSSLPTGVDSIPFGSMRSMRSAKSEAGPTGPAAGPAGSTPTRRPMPLGRASKYALLDSRDSKEAAPAAGALPGTPGGSARGSAKIQPSGALDFVDAGSLRD